MASRKKAVVKLRNLYNNYLVNQYEISEQKTYLLHNI